MNAASALIRTCRWTDCKYPAVVYPAINEIHPYFCARHMVAGCTCNKEGLQESMCNYCKAAFRYNQNQNTSSWENVRAARRRAFTFMCIDHLYVSPKQPPAAETPHLGIKEEEQRFAKAESKAKKRKLREDTIERLYQEFQDHAQETACAASKLRHFAQQIR